MSQLKEVRFRMNRFRIPLGIFAAWAGLFLSHCHAAPVIHQAPLGAEVPEGEVLTLRVVATGSGLRYQWLRDGQAIPGATAPLFLRVRSAQENAGEYSVRIQDDSGGLVETTPVRVSVSSAAERLAGGVWDPHLDVPYPDAVRQGVVSVSTLNGVLRVIPGTTYGGPWSDRIAVLQDGRVYRWGRFQFRAPVDGTFGAYTNYLQDTSKFIPVAATSGLVVDAVENGGVLTDSGALISETQPSFVPPVEGNRLVALAGPAYPAFSFPTNAALRNDGLIFLYTGYTSYPGAPEFPDLKAFTPPWGSDHAAIGVGIDDAGVSAIREDGFMFYQPFFSTNGSPQLIAPPAGTRLVSGTPARAVTLDHRLVQWEDSTWVAAAPQWVQGIVIRNSGDVLILKPGPPVVARQPLGTSVTYGKEISLEVDGGGAGALYS